MGKEGAAHPLHRNSSSGRILPPPATSIWWAKSAQHRTAILRPPRKQSMVISRCRSTDLDLCVTPASTRRNARAAATQIRSILQERTWFSRCSAGRSGQTWNAQPRCAGFILVPSGLSSPHDYSRLRRAAGCKRSRRTRVRDISTTTALPSPVAARSGAPPPVLLVAGCACISRLELTGGNGGG